MTHEQPQPPGAPKKSSKRRGVVLVAVLVVVVLLSLAGYQYSDMMTSEYKASSVAHRNVQARMFADSGIHYAAALLSSPDNAGMLNGNPWNNPELFRGISVQGDNGVQGFFSIIAPSDPDDNGAATSCVFGVMDEGGKINLNALMKIDVAQSMGGKLVHDCAMNLPNMTEEIANAIIDWMDPDSDTSPGGAENDYYMGLSPPYRCKNGPIDSIDELLLVRGVTRDLLYGTDVNRNGFQDTNETSADSFGRGWSAFLTVHSREQNSDSSGRPYINLNSSDSDGSKKLTELALALADTEVSADLAKFIIMYRQNASQVIQPDPTTGILPSAPKSDDLSSYQPDMTKTAGYSLTSIFELINAKITISIPNPNGNGQAMQKTYLSPLYNIDQQRDQLPKLLAIASLTATTEIPARININTAPREVLTAIPGLTATDVEKIISIRPKPSSATDQSTEIFQTPAWLLTEANVSLTTLQQLDQYITTRTQVYRVQSVGYFDGKGPAMRIEAVIDTNGGRPRIIAYRDLTELGRGWSP